MYTEGLDLEFAEILAEDSGCYEETTDDLEDDSDSNGLAQIMTFAEIG